MFLQRPLRRLTTWIAALALLMASLAPSVSQAIGASDARSWTEVCSTAGSRWVAVDASPSDQQPASVDEHLLAHCPCCHFHADSVIPATGPAPTLQIPPGLCEARPAAFLQAPHTLHAWVSAQPRAPPASA